MRGILSYLAVVFDVAPPPFARIKPKPDPAEMRAVLCWLAALPGLTALQISRPLLHAVTGMKTRRYPGIVLALSDENGMQVRIDSYEEDEAEVSAEDLGASEADDPCMILVHMQSPADTGAMFWSEVLMESGAWCVSLSDGAFGTEEEEPIYSVHAPGSVAPELETWGQLLEARHLWSNTSMEVGFPVGTDVEATLVRHTDLEPLRSNRPDQRVDALPRPDSDRPGLSYTATHACGPCLGQLFAAASAGLDAPPRFRIENLVETDWVTQVQANWAPIVIPGCLLIRFPWHPPPAEITAERQVLTLTPTQPQSQP